jgi:hypothetical protein
MVMESLLRVMNAEMRKVGKWTLSLSRVRKRDIISSSFFYIIINNIITITNIINTINTTIITL